MFVLAHLSDPHLGPLPRVRYRELFSKRLIGFANWHIGGRRERHNMPCLAALVKDLLAQNPDHIACTGDLAVIGLDAEYIPGRAFLQTLGTPEHVSLVPGNHDAYVRSTANHPQLHWSEYMTGDGERVEGDPPFPYLRRRGPIGIVGITSAVPTFLHSAQGRVGRDQMLRARKMLRQLREEGLFRVVMIHHPPDGTGDLFRRLVDARRVKRALQKEGAELVLHGHNHIVERTTLPGLDGPVPVVGVPSASSAPGPAYKAGAYNLFFIDGEPGKWTCEMVIRGFGETGTEIAERQRLALYEAPSERKPAFQRNPAP